MEKWHYYLIISILLGIIFTLCLSAGVFFVYAKPNTNSTVNNCTVETTPVQPPVENTPITAVQKTVEAIEKEDLIEDNSTKENEDSIEPVNKSEDEFNSLSPSEQIEQREREKAEEAAMKESKSPQHKEIEETNEKLSEPLENVETSESITQENKLNGESVNSSPDLTDFVSHQVDGNKLTFNSSYYIEMKIGKDGIVNFGEELEGAEIIVIPN